MGILAFTTHPAPIQEDIYAVEEGGNSPAPSAAALCGTGCLRLEFQRSLFRSNAGTPVLF